MRYSLLVRIFVCWEVAMGGYITQVWVFRWSYAGPEDSCDSGSSRPQVSGGVGEVLNTAGLIPSSRFESSFGTMVWIIPHL